MKIDEKIEKNATRRKNRQKTAPERAFFSKKSIFSGFWSPFGTQNPPKMATKKKS